jgi:hypothetical protein
MKYKNTIRLWFDLYQDKNNKANHIIKAAAVVVVIIELLKY